MQRALGHLTLVQKIEQWQKEKLELFVRTVDNHTGLDISKTFNFESDLRLTPLD